MRFEEVEKNEIMLAAGPGVFNDRVRYAYPPLSPDNADRRTVAGEIKEISRAFYFPDFPGMKVVFKEAHRQAAGVADINPWPQNAQRVRLYKIRQRIIKYECADFHADMLSPVTVKNKQHLQSAGDFYVFAEFCYNECTHGIFAGHGCRLCQRENCDH